MLLMLPSLGRAWEESEAVTDSVPVLSRKGAGKLQNHLRNGASRTWYLEASIMEPVMILFPYQSILLIVHSHHLLTWRGRGSVHFLNTTYLLVCSSSTFSLVSLSSDVPNS